MEKKTLLRRVIFGFVFLSMVFSTVYVAIRIIFAPTIAEPGELGIRVKGDYTLMLLQCCVGLLLLFTPSLVTRRLNIYIPSTFFIAYTVFLYCAVFLGEVRSFFYRVPHWDTILHIFSGAMLGAVGIALINLLNDTNKVPVSLSPAFIAIFAFCFAVTLGVIWEIYEFSVDCIFNTNMQKHALENGTLLVGQAALMDTMKDLVVDCVGALAFSIYGYISLKLKKEWTKNFVIHKVDN